MELNMAYLEVSNKLYPLLWMGVEMLLREVKVIRVRVTRDPYQIVWTFPAPPLPVLGMFGTETGTDACKQVRKGSG